METDSHSEAAETKNAAVISKAAIALLSLLAATILITVAFVDIVRPFLSALALAAICAMLVEPFYRRILTLVGGRTGVASTITVLLGLVIIVGPIIGIAYIAGIQAAKLVQGAGQLMETLSGDVDSLKVGTFDFPDWMPFKQKLAQAGPQIVEKVQQLLGSVVSFFGSILSGLTNGTVSFFISLFIFLYAMFFFLPMKNSAFELILANSGLTKELQKKLLDRIISVSRATIKGTLLIGVIQGALGGFGFWMAGIEGAAFWSVIMTVMATIPGIGAASVVFGGAIYLALHGEMTSAIALGIWAIAVVGTIDNVLRPILVGRSAQMSNLMIFVSTLGGLAFFGATGLIFGPVIAGLFVSIWAAVSESALRPHSDIINPQTEHGEKELQQSDPPHSAG